MRLPFITTLLLVLSLSAQATEEKILNLYNWAEYFAPDTLSQFQKETGIKVRYDAYDSDEVLQAKLLSGDSGYDLVWPSNDFMAKQIQAGVYRRLDKRLLTNLKHLDPTLYAKVAEVDAGNQYAVPYMWGTVGVGYDRKEVSKRLGADMPANSLDLIFNPKYASRLAKCGIALQDSPSAILPLALRYLGRDAIHPKPQDYDAAIAMLKQVRPHIRRFLASPSSNELIDGELCVIVTYSGSVLTAAAKARDMKVDRDLVYDIPQSGALMWFDSMVIPKSARHVLNAHAFINFILRPDVVAKISNTTRYANANRTADKLIDPVLARNPAAYPDLQTKQRLFTQQVQSLENSKQEKRAWMRFKGV